jgi:hypothetical protein
MMKIKEIVVFLLCVPTASQATITAAQCKPSDGGPPHVVLGDDSVDHSDLPTDLLAVASVVSCHPRDLVRHYELATGPSGGLKEDIVRPPAASVSSTSDLVVVAMPFSSLRLSPSLVEYLELMPNQVLAVQNLMDQERPIEEPLMHELQATNSELDSAIQQRRNSNSERAIQRLSAMQVKLLEQLMKSNSRLRQHINGMLSSRQRKRLDTFIRTTEVAVGEGN